MLKLNQVGDTIVEVLIGLAVLGAIVGAGYSIATRSLNGVRVSQERSEATKIAESQIEVMRDLVAKTPSNALAAQLGVTPPNTGYCFNGGGAKVTMTGAKEDIGSYPAGCQMGNGGLYHAFIEGTTTTSGTVTYFTGTVHVLWERSGGGQQQTLNLVYRVAY